MQNERRLPLPVLAAAAAVAASAAAVAAAVAVAVADSEPIRSRILFAGAGEEVGTDIIAGPVGRTPTG